MDSQQRRPLMIQVERGPGLVVVHLSGSATMDQADRLNQELRKVAGEPFGKLVMDLADLDFICSMGLGALIVAHVVSRRHNGRVVIAGPQPAIREILETTRLNMIFPVFNDVSSASN